MGDNTKMITQKKQGNNHVIGVKTALESFLKGEEPKELPSAVKTAEFILASYADTMSVRSKFDFQNSDSHSDLTLYLKTGDEIKVNLFKVLGNSGIQPKNVGAQSFISTYFLNNDLQEKFNKLYDQDYNQYLTELFEYQTGFPTIRISKEEVREIFPHTQFNNAANEIRDRFLYSLRENCFSLFQDFCNDNPSLIENAFNTMLKVDGFSIITRIYPKKPALKEPHTLEENIIVEEFKPKVGLSFDDIKLFKTGSNTVSILCGSGCLNLRFKFESGPFSSVKLAIGYRYIKSLQTYDRARQAHNMRTLARAKEILKNIKFVKKNNKSNSIGKCNEAFVYLRLLEDYPDVIQVDPPYCLNMLESYAADVPPEEVKNLLLSSVPTVEQIKDMINIKYPAFRLESIQLVPDSYVNDRLDTSDLQLNIRYHNRRITENLSLKAISKDKKLTVKNPGIGTILGENFFNLSTEDNVKLHNTVALLKEKFNHRELNHQECLEIASKKFADLLQNATQEQIRQGIDKLLGKPLIIVTVYNEIKAYTHEREPVTDDVKIYTQYPTNIQTTLKWDDGNYELSLRVKFSERQEYGWSSLKFAVEQKVH